LLICVHNSLILLAISDLSVVVWSPSTINHQRRSHTNNNGFRFCCRIPRASDSISRRIFYHPMYAPLSIFFFLCIWTLFSEKASRVWCKRIWILGLVWFQTRVCWRLRRKSFQGLLWMWVLILCRWILFVYLLEFC